MMWCKIVVKVLVILMFCTIVIKTDEYLKEFFKSCASTKRPYFCVSYRLLQYIHDFEYEGPLLSNSGIQIVKVHSKTDDTELAMPRYYTGDSPWEKLLTFLKRKLYSFINNHGIALEVPRGVQIVDARTFGDDDAANEKSAGNVTVFQGEARGNKLKVKKIFIMSIIIMAKLLKIKILLATVFFVLLFIKKIILLTAIAIPSVLSHIKNACQKHHEAAHIVEEAPLSSPSWFGSRLGSEDKYLKYDQPPYYPPSSQYSYNSPYSYYY